MDRVDKLIADMREKYAESEDDWWINESLKEPLNDLRMLINACVQERDAHRAYKVALSSVHHALKNALEITREAEILGDIFPNACAPSGENHD